MVLINKKDPGLNWLHYCKAVFEQGASFHDESEKIKELLDVFIVFDKFNTEDETFKKYADPKLIELYRRKMVSLEIIPELNTTYGKRLYDQQGFDQVEWLVKRLRHKPETKAATISLLLPNDPGPRIPCLTTIDVKIRDNKLQLLVFYRSQNASRAYGNFIGVHDLHKKIAAETGYPMGQMKFFIASAHIYEKDYEFVKGLLRDNNL